MRIIGEQPYKVPRGFYDMHFDYVFDIEGFTGGPALNTTLQNATIPVTGGSDFLLRRICQPLGSGQLQFRDSNGRNKYSTDEPIGAGADIPILPEIYYPATSQIAFDNAGVIYTTLVPGGEGGSPDIKLYQIVFEGVKRRRGSIQCPTFKYREVPFSYQFPLTVNWAHYIAATSNLQPPHSFQMQILNYDFELMAFNVIKSDGSAPNPAAQFKIQFYNLLREQLSSAPLALLNEFPQITFNPPILFPQQSQIFFDITSLLGSAHIPSSYVLEFIGIIRVPV